jgi:hypothetical protein
MRSDPIRTAHHFSISKCLGPRVRFRCREFLETKATSQPTFTFAMPTSRGPTHVHWDVGCHGLSGRRHLRQKNKEIKGARGETQSTRMTSKPRPSQPPVPVDQPPNQPTLRASVDADACAWREMDTSSPELLLLVRYAAPCTCTQQQGNTFCMPENRWSCRKSCPMSEPGVEPCLNSFAPTRWLPSLPRMGGQQVPEARAIIHARVSPRPYTVPVSRHARDSSPFPHPLQSTPLQTL